MGVSVLAVQVGLLMRRKLDQRIGIGVLANNLPPINRAKDPNSRPPPEQDAYSGLKK